MSAQAMALVPKIKEVEAVAECDSRIYEAHPEVTFAELNCGKAVNTYEKELEWAGDAPITPREGCADRRNRAKGREQQGRTSRYRRRCGLCMDGVAHSH